MADSAIVRLDALRARRIGQMLVTGADPEFDVDPNEHLVSLAELDGKTLLDDYVKRHARYGTTPFDPNGDVLRLYAGGLTIWSGYPGNGKTTLLRQFINHCLHRNSSVFLASLEEHPENVLINMAAVAAGSVLPNAHQLQWFIDQHGPRFRLWSTIGTARHRDLLAVIRKLASEGVRHAVIDSLMCLDIASDDFESQRKFANLVANTARSTGVHIHLVAHPRKAISSTQEPDLNDVAGAKEIGGIADNIIFVRRGKGETLGANSTGMMVSIKKQRHGSGGIGEISGWFHRDIRQFHIDKFPHGPTRYLPDDAYQLCIGQHTN